MAYAKREIFMRLGERTITERDSSIVLDIVDLFSNIIDDVAERRTSSTSRDRINNAFVFFPNGRIEIDAGVMTCCGISISRYREESKEK